MKIYILKTESNILNAYKNLEKAKEDKQKVRKIFPNETYIIEIINLQ